MVDSILKARVYVRVHLAIGEATIDGKMSLEDKGESSPPLVSTHVIRRVKKAMCVLEGGADSHVLYNFQGC